MRIRAFQEAGQRAEMHPATLFIRSTRRDAATAAATSDAFDVVLIYEYTNLHHRRTLAEASYGLVCIYVSLQAYRWREQCLFQSGAVHISIRCIYGEKMETDGMLDIASGVNQH